MNPPKLAQRDSVRLFSIHEQNVAVVTGKKPKNYEVPHLTKHGEKRLLVEFPASEGLAPESGGLDSYIIVQPVLITAKLGAVEVWHADGCDRVQVEALGPNASEAASDGIFGSSQDFSLEAAIKDALSRLTPEAQREPQLFDVVSMGALYGGFSGFSRLFVRMLPADIHPAEDFPVRGKCARKNTANRSRCQGLKP